MDPVNSATARRPPASVLVGRVLSGIVMLLLLIDAAGKLIIPQIMIDTTPAKLRLPHDVSLYRVLGGILAACVAFHLWPRTDFLGAILITGFLGGAVAVNVRAEMPLAANTMFGIYVGVLMWIGFYLRDARLRTVIF